MKMKINVEKKLLSYKEKVTIILQLNYNYRSQIGFCRMKFKLVNICSNSAYIIEKHYGIIYVLFVDLI